MRRPDLDPFLIAPDATIREAMARIDPTGAGIALVVDGARRLIGTITDGDVRRAILAGIDLGSEVTTLVARKAATYSPHRPITAPPDATDEILLDLMTRHIIRQVPLVTLDGTVVDLVLLSDLASSSRLPLRAMVMAGGYGTRLLPLTEEIPKPMLQVGDRPLLEHIVLQLQRAGIQHVNISTHYKGDVIERHFGDGRAFGLDIHYVTEDAPLGTAGAVSLLDASEDPLLVINGDVLTKVDYAAMLQFHRENHADMTVGVRAHEIAVPYGIVDIEDHRVVGISEKPVLKHFINAGIYLLNPDAKRHVPPGTRYDMPDLIAALIASGRSVVSFPVHEYWRDVGQPDDYLGVNSDAGQEGR